MKTISFLIALFVFIFFQPIFSYAQPSSEEVFAPAMHNLSMFNDPYELYIFPEKEEAKPIDVQMILMKDQKIVLQEWINVDTILQYCEIIHRDSLPMNFRDEYIMSEFKYHGVRSNSIYFNAFFKPKTANKSIPILLKWYYIGPKKGKRLIHN